MLSKTGHANLSTAHFESCEMVSTDGKLRHDFRGHLLRIMAEPAANAPLASLHIHFGIYPWQVFLPLRFVGCPFTSGTLLDT